MVGLFIVFQGITGAIAQQRFFLLAWSEPDIYSVNKVSGQPLEPSQILNKVRAAKPDFRPAHVMYPSATAPETAVIVMGGRKPTGMDMSRVITMDQYSGNVIAERASSAGWVGIATGLHKWANYGTVGRVFLTMFGVLTIAFLVTGIGNWWTTRSYAKRWSGSKKWHRRLGIVIAPLLLLTAISGVALNLFTWSEKTTGNSVVASNMMAAMRNQPAASVNIDLDTAYNIAIERVGPQHLTAFSKTGDHAQQHWFAFTNFRLQRTDVLVNGQSGKATIYPAGTLTGGSGLRGWLFPIHSGYLIGWFGGVIMTFIGLSLLFWLVSGASLLRGKRSGGRKHG